uniref:Uncharacterized protein n=1 Tax=Trichogramma kaykai TaxID=54128 RepID=A0ABD2XDN4_9HYME
MEVSLNFDETASYEGWCATANVDAAAAASAILSFSCFYHYCCYYYCVDELAPKLPAQDGVKDEVNTSTTYCSGIVGTVDALAQLRLQLSALSCRADGERPADPQPVLPG